MATIPDAVVGGVDTGDGPRAIKVVAAEQGSRYGAARPAVVERDRVGASGARESQGTDQHDGGENAVLHAENIGTGAAVV